MLEGAILGVTQVLKETVGLSTKGPVYGSL